MKKNALLCLLLILTLALTACGGGGDQSAVEEGPVLSETTEPEKEETPAETEAPQTAEAEPEVEKELKEGPFEYSVLPDGTAKITKLTSYSDSELNIPSALGGHRVTEIGQQFAAGFYSIEAITIPDGVTVIGEFAFAQINNLARIQIPASVKEVGMGVLVGCAKLTDIEVAPGSAYLEVKDGCLITKPDGCLIVYPYANLEENLAIPQGVRGIGAGTFAYCEQLQTVTLPEGLTKIGTQAFGYCSSLTRVTLPDSVTELEENPFWACAKLSEFVVSPDHPYLEVVDHVLYSKPDHRLIFYPYALESTSYEIPEGVCEIGGYAFAPDMRQWNRLEKVTIPESVEKIGEYAFNHSKVKAIMLPSTMEFIGDHAFYECYELTSINLPDGLTEIGDSTFDFCTNVSEFIIPESVTRIGNRAFACCKTLTSVTIPSYVTWIGEDAFYYCEGLKEVVLPESVTFIGENAFSSCAEDLIVTVPAGSYAEQYCKDCHLQYKIAGAAE